MRSIIMIVQMGGNSTCDDYDQGPGAGQCPCPQCSIVALAEEVLLKEQE